MATGPLHSGIHHVPPTCVIPSPSAPALVPFPPSPHGPLLSSPQGASWFSEDFCRRVLCLSLPPPTPTATGSKTCAFRGVGNVSLCDTHLQSWIESRTEHSVSVGGVPAAGPCLSISADTIAPAIASHCTAGISWEAFSLSHR